MIEAWRNIRPRLLANEQVRYPRIFEPLQTDAYDEAGALINFLAESGDAGAFDALGRGLREAPIDVRVAVVNAFFVCMEMTREVPATGPHVVSVNANIPQLPGGAADAAIERLLVSSLDDTEKRIGMKGHWNDVSWENPRICDVAAFVLSRRWPEKYQFQWSANAPKADSQIESMRSKWRTESGLRP